MPPPPTAPISCCCCCDSDDENELDAIIAMDSKDKDDGPLRNASSRCVDLFWFLLIVASWFGLSVLGLIVLGFLKSDSLPKGKPERLLYGLDYSGKICGSDKGVKKLPKSFPMPSGALVCLKECPKRTDYDTFICEYDVQKALDSLLESGETERYWDRGRMGVLDRQCNFQWRTTEFINHCIFNDAPDFALAWENSAPKTLATTSSTPSVDTTPQPSVEPTLAPTERSSWNASFPCTQQLSTESCTFLAGKNATNRRFFCNTIFCPDCIAAGACDYACGFCDEPISTQLPNQQRAANGAKRFFEKLASDLTVAYKPMLIYGFGVSAAAGFGYLALLQIPCLLPIIIWTLLLSVLASLLAAGIMTAQTANRWQREDPRLHGPREIRAARVLASCLIVAAWLYACVLIALRKRISLALGIVKEAARAFLMMPMLLITPLIQCAGQLCFFLVWIIYAIYLASSGKMKSVTQEFADGSEITYKQFNYSRKQQYAALYLVFCWFWTFEFIEALGDLTVSVAIVTWYFSREKHKAAVCLPTTYGALLLIVMKRHAGTAAAGALVIAIAQAILMIVGYINRFTKSKESSIHKIFLSCLQCIVHMIERCLRFLNKHAYVESAIHGIGFCLAGRRAFAQLVNNGFRIACCLLVTNFVLSLGALGVTITVTVLFYGHLRRHHAHSMHSFIPVSIIVFFMAFGAVKLFNGVLRQAVTCILHCFVVDEAEYSNKPFASGALKGTIATTSERCQGRLGASIPNWLTGKIKGDTPHLREKFNEFDIDRSGKINPCELDALLQTCTGVKPSDSDIKAMMTSIDKDNDGEISYPEFVQIHNRAVSGKLEFKALSEAMLAFDKLASAIDDESDASYGPTSSPLLNDDEEEAISPPEYYQPR